MIGSGAWKVTEDGWLTTARRRLSPNQDARPDPDDLSLIVIHGISLPPGEFGGPWIDRLFTNTLLPEAHPYFEAIHHIRVSAHLVIRRSGEPVQYVPFQRRAWHAGVSSYGGREHCNDFSIGIELEGTDTLAYTDAQYRALAHTINALVCRYPGLSVERLAGHSDIAPGRKTDPGAAFEWARLRSMVAESEKAWAPKPEG